MTSAKRTDTILTGRIRSVERDQLSRSRLTGLSEEITLGVTIELAEFGAAQRPARHIVPDTQADW
jgi:hypothetical protein